jgi:A/G-specific adenine glycosylase
MLQQTQVSRVLEYLPRFLQAFPTVQALAKADEAKVLGLWAGLGYYRRAKLLHAAAKAVMNIHAGEIPSSVEGLLTLPGVGRYTAGAIASIAQHHTAPILDGNITRVLMRLSACQAQPTDRQVQAQLWQLATQIAQHAADEQGSCAIVNEAMMELGATVCTPANPQCPSCPLAGLCRAHQLGLTQSIPQPKPTAKTTTLHLAAFIVTDGGSRLLLQQRPDKGLFASMLTPPMLESPKPISAQLRDEFCSMHGLQINPEAAPAKTIRPLTTYSHQLTHRTLKIAVYRAALTPRRSMPVDCQWHGVDAVPNLPIANAHRKALNFALQTELS